VDEARGRELVETMESILPTGTLRKFYRAFKTADPSHALVQVSPPRKTLVPVT